MKIIYTSLFVNNQDKALKFYTELLGFVKKSDITAREYRWLTVVSPDDQKGTELVLEPNDNPAAKTYQKAMQKFSGAVNEPIPPPAAIPAKQLPRLGDFSLEPPAGYHVTLGSMRRGLP